MEQHRIGRIKQIREHTGRIFNLAVDRIQNEQKKFHTVELFISSLNKDDFQPFVNGLQQKFYEVIASVATAM